jgi:excisionase family DNA binding protein
MNRVIHKSSKFREPEYLSIDDLCCYFNISRRTIHRLLANKVIIPDLHIGRHARFRIDRVEQSLRDAFKKN